MELGPAGGEQHGPELADPARRGRVPEQGVDQAGLEALGPRPPEDEERHEEDRALSVLLQAEDLADVIAGEGLPASGQGAAPLQEEEGGGAVGQRQLQRAGVVGGTLAGPPAPDATKELDQRAEEQRGDADGEAGQVSFLNLSRRLSFVLEMIFLISLLNSS